MPFNIQCCVALRLLKENKSSRGVSITRGENFLILCVSLYFFFQIRWANCVLQRCFLFVFTHLQSSYSLSISIPYLNCFCVIAFWLLSAVSCPRRRLLLQTNKRMKKNHVTISLRFRTHSRAQRRETQGKLLYYSHHSTLLIPVVLWLLLSRTRASEFLWLFCPQINKRDFFTRKGTKYICNAHILLVSFESYSPSVKNRSDRSQWLMSFMCVASQKRFLFTIPVRGKIPL